ncbi:helix-turn-helix domain-containing protein [Methylophaga sp. OBS1]|uniref:helix-turn-helix domain-containing protein n=1 Tax=Methylophaga sp. OBS1 TaxID=2991933 RepID=UPI002250CA7E|nr:helix-turn-helix domain-containing protein [Methylophaga sp. OBS1]MCX4191137.1 helix-turn-helix domain-containing protein [Methylophaga sp. OBS1]MCX4191917.1 helix-turn-helix domain-containing protein [Methylophaga sp. OBS1]
MDISQVAKKSGLPASTLRYYEEKGLIHSTGRQGLRRTFSPAVLDQLSLISLGRAAGFSLDEIVLMFEPGSDQPRIDRQLLSQKANELDKKIRQLTTMRDGLRHAAACTAPSHLACPKFRRLMNLATLKVRDNRRKGVRGNVE